MSSFRVLLVGPVAKKARVRAFCRGVVALGGEVIEGLAQRPADVRAALARGPIAFAVTCGMHAREATVRGYLRGLGIPLLVLDLGYFRRAKGPTDETGYNQLGLNRLNWVPAIECPADRWQTHGITVAEPVQGRDKIALILGQVPGDSQHSLDAVRLRAWLAEEGAALRAQGYELVWRPHPAAPLEYFPVKAERSISSLAADLARAAVAVCYNSTAGVEALIAGVPVICHPSAHYAHVADLRDRAALLTHLRRLAWTQWTCDELASGEALRWMARFAPLLPNPAAQPAPEPAPAPVAAPTPAPSTASEPPLLVTLFYGDVKARRHYQPFFERWLKHHLALGVPVERILVITDTLAPAPRLSSGVAVIPLSIEHRAEILRTEQPFDRKGALMCELLLRLNQPFLMLDNDAFLQTAASLDSEELRPDILIGMPQDLGALCSDFGMYLAEPYTHVFKRCAGVAWFGDTTPGKRAALVDEYIKRWHELRTGGKDGGVPWEPHLSRLLEQHAWSYAAQLLEQPLLGDAWNWPAHIEGFATSQHQPAIKHVHHEFGRKKWKALGRKAPKNV